MSLVNQTVWVVGGVGVVGRGITRGLLQAGAHVIVNSRSEERLDKIQTSLGNPERLQLVHGSLLPGQASKTVADALNQTGGALHHVVAHGAVRWWAKPTAGKYEYYEYKAGCDETYALNINATERLLDMAPEAFAQSSAQLATLHFSAAQQLIPRLTKSASSSSQSSLLPSYTFVTGDGSGKPGGERTAMGQINSHHVWGLSSALRRELQGVVCQEVRVGLPVHKEDPRQGGKRPLSEDIGDLCAGLVTLSTKEDHGRMIKLEEFQQLNDELLKYKHVFDGKVGELPRYECDEDSTTATTTTTTRGTA